MSYGKAVRDELRVPTRDLAARPNGQQPATR